jgi:hypothetical protein
MMAPFGMYTNPSRRTGAAAVREVADRAGTIASRSGNATVAPIPRRNVLRGNAIFVMIICVSPAYVSFFTFIRNGSLVAMPTMIDENRYPSGAA